MDADGQLDPVEEDRLYDHYGIGGGTQTYSDTTTGRDTKPTASTRPAGSHTRLRAASQGQGACPGPDCLPAADVAGIAALRGPPPIARHRRLCFAVTL